MATIQASHGGADSTASACRVSNLWVATGSGTAPTTDDDLINPDGTVTAAFPGAVQGIDDPFKPQNQQCDERTTTLPVVDVRGGDVGAEYALVEFDILVPEGASWVALQLESPQDNNGQAGQPESGAWS